MKTGLCGARRDGAGGDLLVAFAYDGDGQRVAETSADGTERRFLVDLNNSTGYAQVVEEHIVGDGLAMVYAYRLDLIAQHRVADGDGAGALETQHFGYDALIAATSIKASRPTTPPRPLDIPRPRCQRQYHPIARRPRRWRTAL